MIKKGLVKLKNWANALNYHVNKLYKRGADRPTVEKFLFSRDPDIKLTKSGRVSTKQSENFDYKKFYEPRKMKKALGEALDKAWDKGYDKMDKIWERIDNRYAQKRAQKQTRDEKRQAEREYNRQLKEKGLVSIDALRKRVAAYYDLGGQPEDIKKMLGDIEGLAWTDSERPNISVAKSSLSDQDIKALMHALPKKQQFIDYLHDKQMAGFERVAAEYSIPAAAGVYFEDLKKAYYEFDDMVNEVADSQEAEMAEKNMMKLGSMLHHKKATKDDVAEVFGALNRLEMRVMKRRMGQDLEDFRSEEYLF